MILEDRIKSLVALGKLMKNLSTEALETLAYSCEGQNPFFTPKNVKKAVSGIIMMLDEIQLTAWVNQYNVSSTKHKIGVVMAGNIPAVGFHDALCVLISGDQLHYKPSSKDTVLIDYVLNELIQIAPEYKQYIYKEDRLDINALDAIIATGSTNTSRYFEQYFSKKPHVIRKGRTSCAVLTGKETSEQLIALSEDVFDYFGLGCRNVSKLLVPENYDFTPFLKITEGRTDLIMHSKYFNNYEYHKSILLVNRVPHLDSGTLLLKEDKSEASPMSVLHYETYKDIEKTILKLNAQSEKIQCVVGESGVSFGNTQFPTLSDYADGIDTMKFLSEL